MPAITSCPDCGSAAEITERFTLQSTDGPIAHVALNCSAGHHFRMAADGLAAHFALPPSLLPRALQLCIHCRQTPAGFWVSRKNGVVAHRPWCLSCCQELDRTRCDVIPFASAAH
jgi:hypothetical protein